MPPHPPNRSGPRHRMRFVIFLLIGLPVCGLYTQIDYTEPVLPGDALSEPTSQPEALPGLVEPGLGPRALPIVAPTPDPASQNYIPLFRLTKPYYSSLDAPAPPSFLPPQGGATRFRPVISYEPDVGLHPRFYRPGIFEIYTWFGLAQSFDSNVNLTSSNHIADFFLSPKVGVGFQLGTPDSVHTVEYDTILALSGSYEAYADIFYQNPYFSAFNDTIELNGRIGRDAAIWRPFFTFSDLTGSSLLITEFTNRIRRLRMLTGLTSQYHLTELLGLNQTLSYFWFDHPNSNDINFTSWQAQSELTYQILHATKALLWTEYRSTRPDQGSSGEEILAGIGWEGRPDPRIYSEAHIGWDILSLSGFVPGRSNLSGLRFQGYTTFDWSERTRLTFKYDRDYVFNESDVNDNYTSTLFQFKAEFYLGSNWYITPYFGVALLDYETSHRLLLQWRPELEISYAINQGLFPNDPRIFLKAGYQQLSILKGPGEPIPDWRISLGTHWKF